MLTKNAVLAVLPSLRTRTDAGKEVYHVLSGALKTGLDVPWVNLHYRLAGELVDDPEKVLTSKELERQRAALKKVKPAAAGQQETNEQPEKAPVASKRTPMAKKLYVSHVKSNLKEGVDVDLHPHTLIVGANASGKDTVVQAVEFALRSRISDLMGKDDVGRVQTLMALAPGRKGTLMSEIVLSDGQSVSCLIKMDSKGKVSDAIHILPESLTNAAVFPLRDLRTLFADKGLDAQRRFFLDALGASITQETIDAIVPANHHDLYSAVAGLIRNERPEASPATILALVREVANKKKLEAGRDAKSANTIADGIAEDIKGVPTEGQVEAAEAEVKRLSDEIAALPPSTPTIDTEALQNQITEVREKMDNATAQATALQEQLLQIAVLSTDEIQAIQVERDLFRAVVLVADTQAHRVEIGAMEACAICQQGLDHATAVQAAQSNRTYAIQRLEQLDAAEASSKQAAKLQTDLDTHTTYYAQGEAYLAQAEPMLTNALNAAAPADHSDLHTEWATASEAARTLRSQHDQFAGVRKAKAHKGQHEEDQDKFKRLVGACDEAIQELLEGARGEFVAAVRKFMPDAKKMPNGGTFDLRLNDGKRKVCEIGLEGGDGWLRTALSGAEWSIVLIAIAATVSADAPFAVLIPEERAYDPATLANLMRALSKCPAQILLTSTVKPKGRSPAGWHVLEVEGLERPEVELGEPEITEEEELPPEPTGEVPIGTNGTNGEVPEVAPFWAARNTGLMLFHSKVEELRGDFLGAFGVELERTATHELEGGNVWIAATNGAALYQSGESVTVYAGSSGVTREELKAREGGADSQPVTM